MSDKRMICKIRTGVNRFLAVALQLRVEHEERSYSINRGHIVVPQLDYLRSAQLLPVTDSTSKHCLQCVDLAISRWEGWRIGDLRVSSPDGELVNGTEEDFVPIE